MKRPPRTNYLRLGTAILLLFTSQSHLGCEFITGSTGDDVDMAVQFTIPITITLPEQPTIEGLAVNADGLRELRTEQIFASIDLVDLEPAVRDYEGRIKMIRVDSIVLLISHNTLNLDIVALPVHLGSQDSTFEGADLLGVIGPIAASGVGTARASMSAVGRASASTVMKSFSFKAGIWPSFLVEENYLSNRGHLDAELVFSITIVADQLD